ncbi:hypothetical protein [Thiohalophilus sp.]|uniref:hypothetical protein n=1 Tax=Thiohalophilus sp. TaxID=3028392 RepID=UPI002ACEA991|nr:hypothetical protein [Thiohalophilus sp.]MDZ7662947.1 hypothetical protein [Thiohalophilus sp.]
MLFKKNNYLTIKQYLKERFEGPNRPSSRSVRRWIQYGYLPGKIIKGRYYVDVEAEKELIITGNPEIDSLIWKMSVNQELLGKHQEFTQMYQNRIPMYLRAPPLLKNIQFYSHQ